MTAGHCADRVKARQMSVRLGEHDHTGLYLNEPELFETDVIR